MKKVKFSYALVRDNMAGVFIGKLVELNGKSWTMRGARKIHYWHRAAAVEGIAVGDVRKIDQWRVTPAVTNVSGRDLVQVIRCKSVKAMLETLPVWRPE